MMNKRKVILISALAGIVGGAVIGLVIRSLPVQVDVQFIGTPPPTEPAAPQPQEPHGETVQIPGPMLPEPELPGKVADREPLEKERAEQQKIQLDSRIASLGSLQGEELVTYAAALDLPDNPARMIYPQYVSAKEDLGHMLKDQGMGERHPVVQAQKGVIESIRNDLSTAAVNLRGKLEAERDVNLQRLNGTR